MNEQEKSKEAEALAVRLRREEREVEEDESELAASELSKEGLGRRLRRAAADADPWVVEECLKLGADPLIKAAGFEESALVLAARSKSLACVLMIQEALRALGEPTCSKEALGRPGYGWPNRGETLKALLSGNASDAAPLGAVELGASKALEKAIDSGYDEEISVWAEAFPGLVETPIRSGLLPLALAAALDQLACVQELLRAGADPAGRDHNDQTALMVAAAMSTACCKELLPVSDPRAADVMGLTALMSASCAMTHAGIGNAENVRRLLPVSDVEAKDRDGRTALMLALRGGAGDCADELGEPQGELTFPGDETTAMERLRWSGREDWAARVEREWLARQTPGSGAKSKGPRM